MKQILTGIFIGIAISGLNAAVESATYDERKAEQLKQNREIRRGNERKYEDCVRRCLGKKEVVWAKN